MIDSNGKKIRLVVAGIECSTWSDASIDSAIDVPADEWNLMIWNPAMGHLDPKVKAGAQMQIFNDSELVLTGIVDNLKEAVGRSGRAIQLSGRDLAGQLINCSVPIFNGKQLTLQYMIQEFVLKASLGTIISDFKIQDNSWLKNKASIEPGESIWDALAKAAQVTGQWIWMNADGSFEIGNPFNNSYQVQTPLTLMFSGTNNNVLSAEYDEDVSNVYTDIQILSQDRDAQKILAQGTSDTPYSFKRLKLVTSSDAETQAEAQALLNKVIKDNDLEAYSLTCDVAGWMIDGKVWQTGWTVTLESDVLIRANAKWVVMGRTLNLSRKDGKTTRLKLKRQGDWSQPLKLKQQPTQKKPKKRKTKDASDD